MANKTANKALAIDAAHTAIICLEMQRGVVGDLSELNELRAAVEQHQIAHNIAELMTWGREKGASVVHCIAEFRVDRKGSSANCPLLETMSHRAEHLLQGSPASAIIPALEPHASDLVVSRLHGLSPFSGTALDISLRSMGITTIVATGVSLNIGIFGLVLEAVNLGYRVIVPRDAVVGVPQSYSDEVIKYSLSLMADITDSEFLMSR